MKLNALLLWLVLAAQSDPLVLRASALPLSRSMSTGVLTHTHSRPEPHAGPHVAGSVEPTAPPVHMSWADSHRGGGGGGGGGGAAREPVIGRPVSEPTVGQPAHHTAVGTPTPNGIHAPAGAPPQRYPTYQRIYDPNRGMSTKSKVVAGALGTATLAAGGLWLGTYIKNHKDEHDP